MCSRRPQSVIIRTSSSCRLAVMAHLLMAANDPLPRVEMIRIKIDDHFPVDQGFLVHVHRFKECGQFASR